MSGNGSRYSSQLSRAANGGYAARRVKGVRVPLPTLIPPIRDSGESLMVIGFCGMVLSLLLAPFAMLYSEPLNQLGFTLHMVSTGIAIIGGCKLHSYP